MGLFTLRSHVNKGGLCSFIGFLDYNNKVTCRFDYTVCLGGIVFNTYLGHGNLSMFDVFENVVDIIDGDKKFETKELMNVMIPNYDPELFKDYHVKRILGWCEEIIYKTKKNRDVGKDKEEDT